MKTKREKIEHAYAAVLFGSLTVGVLLLVFSSAFFVLSEVWGRNAMRNPDAQADLYAIVWALAFVMLPTLGIAFLLAAHTMWRYRKVVRYGNAT